MAQLLTRLLESLNLSNGFDAIEWIVIEIPEPKLLSRFGHTEEGKQPV